MRPVVLFLGVVVSCGHQGTDDPVADGPDAGAADSYAFRGECAYPLASDGAIEFPMTAATAQTATRPVVVVNACDHALIGPEYLRWEATGADAADFSVRQAQLLASSDNESCYLHQWLPQVLSVGQGCRVDIDFHPTSPGPKQATLHLTQSGTTVEQTLDVRGTAIAAPAGVYASAPDVFVVTSGPGLGTTLLVTNAGNTGVALGEPVVTGGFGLSTPTWNCPAVLTPGGACSIAAPMFPPSRAGCSMGTLTTSTAAFTVPLTARFIPATVALVASLHGSIHVDPLGKTCAPGATFDCQFSFDTPTALTLTAQPESGAHFTSWTGPSAASCGSDPVCALAPGFSNVSLVAEFASPQAKAIAVTIVGTGTVTGLPGGCSASCTLYSEPGGDIELTAATTGSFVGWSGDCVGTGTCNLGTVLNDRAVTATFSP